MQRFLIFLWIGRGFANFSSGIIKNWEMLTIFKSSLIDDILRSKFITDKTMLGIIVDEFEHLTQMSLKSIYG